MAPGVTPGWYPDPLSRHERRYWDGDTWTAHVADGAEVADDPLAAAAEPAPGVSEESAPTQATAGTSAPGWYPDPLEHAEVRYYDGRAWTTHVASGGKTSEDSLVAAAATAPPATPRPKPSRPAVVGAAAMALLVLVVGALVIIQSGNDDGDGGDDAGATAVSDPDSTDVVTSTTSLPPLAEVGFLDLGVAGTPTIDTADPSGTTISTPTGVVLEVPAGAHEGPVGYTITETPIVGDGFGELVNPVSNLVTIDNGDVVAEEPVIVEIPAIVPDGSFAMAVYYDEVTGTVEPLPLIEIGDDHVTAYARHFSSIFVSAISFALLPDDVATGFAPGTDDWQFTNYGSYMAPGGLCSGQSLSMLWYYTEQRLAGAASLNGQYDNANNSATPVLQWDDRNAYRLASMVQVDEVARYNDLERFFDKMIDLRRDRWQHASFVYSMLITGEPQYVGIYSSLGGGHAMVVYGAKDGDLLIADPNYPGNAARKITFDSDTGVLGPYMSGDNAAALGKPYERIGYFAKTALVDWNYLGGRWTDFLEEDIGDDAFPTYALEVEVVDEDGTASWVPLNNGHTVEKDQSSITVRAAGASTWNDRFRVYRWDETLGLGGWDVSFVVPLEEGTNRLGFEALGWKNNSMNWVDFERLNVIRGEPEETPIDLVFVIDLTGSMEDDISSVKGAATEIVGVISADGGDWRVGIVGYRDFAEDSDPVFEDYAWSSDEATVIGNINALTVYGGGDEPEAVLEALMRAIHNGGTIGAWRDGVNKQIILMGDAPPHVPGQGGETPASVADAAERVDPAVIQTLLVGNSGTFSADAEASFRELSELTFGQTFTAADADEVPAALQESIGAAVASPVGTGGGDEDPWWRQPLLIVSFALFIGGAAVVIWRLLHPSLERPAVRAVLITAAVTGLGLAGVAGWLVSADDDTASRSGIDAPSLVDSEPPPELVVPDE